MPNSEIQQAAGSDYFSELELRLALRKILETGGVDSLNKREKRGIFPFIKPALRFASKAIANKQLQEFFQGLFTGDNGILSALSAFRAASPEDRKAFSELSKKVSEFETETRKLFVDVLKKTDDVESTLLTLQKDHYELSNNMVGFKEMVLMHQSLLSDLTRLTYVANVYTMHFQAFSDCRAGKISPTFIPISLLADKLRQLELQMPADKALLISSAEAFRYYKLTIAECVYDSRGGLVKIGVPLRKKQSAFQLYEYKPIQFAYQDFTCSLETPATLVVKDLNSNDVFPITELEIDACDVSTGLCRLPMSTDMDTSSICIAILLKGSSAEIIKENCKFHCTKRRIPELSKIAEDVYVGIHLPSKGIEIRCENERIPYSTAIEIGSTRFSLACTNCELFWNNKLVGSSSGATCKDVRIPTVETILPIQFSDLKDLKPDGESGLEKTVFTGAAEIVNMHYNPETGANFPGLDIIPVLWTAATVLWDALQSIAVAYIFYRQHYVPNAVGLALGGMIPGVFASRYACVLTNDVYVILYTILITVLLLLVPTLLQKAFKFFKDLYTDAVDSAAVRNERDRRAALVIS
ncbi:unnamed protein product [Orchesella dallaii]|uniref:Uncharacterized protein n=1 Tax=Orchesella dallaii TaxID=48710 RepID=A0ABP1PQ43_9HEXA